MALSRPSTLAATQAFLSGARFGSRPQQWFRDGKRAVALTRHADDARVPVGKVALELFGPVALWVDGNEDGLNLILCGLLRLQNLKADATSARNASAWQQSTSPAQRALRIP